MESQALTDLELYELLEDEGRKLDAEWVRDSWLPASGSIITAIEVGALAAERHAGIEPTRLDSIRLDCECDCEAEEVELVRMRFSVGSMLERSLQHWLEGDRATAEDTRESLTLTTPLPLLPSWQWRP